jgi:L-arabinose isomerase
VKPIFDMPNLPVARVMWRPKAGLVEGIRQWICAGGAHHTVLTYAATARMLMDWADIMGIESVHLAAETRSEDLKGRLDLADVLWKLRSL